LPCANIRIPKEFLILRDMKFADILGHQEVKERLIHQVTSERVSHAQLIVSPPGVGALPLALAYTALLGCKNPSANDSCGECGHCKKIANLAHPDLHITFPYPNVTGKSGVSGEIFFKEFREAFTENPFLSLSDWGEKLDSGNKQLNIPKAEVTDIIKHMSLKPNESEYRFLIMWCPENLGETGNMLLKFIEEPPPKTLLLFVGSDPEKILNTIISRTQKLNLKRPSREEIKGFLVLQKGVEEQKATKISQMCEGDVNKALKLTLTFEDEYSEKLFDLFRFCIKTDGVELINWSQEISALNREEQKNFLTYGQHTIREVLFINEGAEALVYSTNQHLDKLKGLARFLNAGQIAMLNSEIDKALYHLERNLNKKLVFLDFALRVLEIVKAKNLTLLNT
jgi:DNA polymerase-3 subunit delta'